MRPAGGRRRTAAAAERWGSAGTASRPPTAHRCGVFVPGLAPLGPAAGHADAVSSTGRGLLLGQNGKRGQRRRRPGREERRQRRRVEAPDDAPPLSRRPVPRGRGQEGIDGIDGVGSEGSEGVGIDGMPIDGIDGIDGRAGETRLSSPRAAAARARRRTRALPVHQ